MSAGKAARASILAAPVILGQGTAGAQQSGELEAVETTHEAYHAAFGKEDMDLMSDVWLHDQSVRLIVPPRDKILKGWSEIAAEFEGAFEALDIISLNTKDAQTIVGEELAWIVNVHELEMRTGDGQVIKPSFFSTHIFQKVDDRWLMVHHQASAPPAPGQ
jgi:ketosteroid isomerase-like protein